MLYRQNVITTRRRARHLRLHGLDNSQCQGDTVGDEATPAGSVPSVVKFAGTARGVELSPTRSLSRHSRPYSGAVFRQADSVIYSRVGPLPHARCCERPCCENSTRSSVGSTRLTVEENASPAPNLSVTSHEQRSLDSDARGKRRRGRRESDRPAFPSPCIMRGRGGYQRAHRRRGAGDLPGRDVRRPVSRVRPTSWCDATGQYHVSTPSWPAREGHALLRSRPTTIR